MNNYCPNTGVLRSATPEEKQAGARGGITVVEPCGRREGRWKHTVALKRGKPDVADREVRVPMSCPACRTKWVAVYVFSGPDEVAVPA